MPRVFQPVDKTVEITVQGTLMGELVENKYYAKGASAIDASMVAALASLVDLWVSSTMLAKLPADYHYVRTIARDLTVAASFEVINNTHAGEVGAITTAVNPNNSTLAVHRNTGLSGVKAKSRIYWPGIAQAISATPNTVSTADGAAIVGILDTLRADILADTTNTWTYGYVQRVIGGVKLAVGNFIEVFSHSLTDFVLDSMRARLPGHGL